MNKISRESIKQLLESEDNTTISLYLPTHRFPIPENINEDKIRFKNLIRTAKEALIAKGVDDDVVEQLVGGLETDIYDNDTFWQYTTEGMALFSSPSGVRYFHLPIECEERVVVGDRYDIAPLLALESYDNHYYLLALAVHNPVLYKGDMYGIEQVGIDLPKSPEAALNIDELHANSKTDRPGGHRQGRNPGAKAHGQGDSHQAGQEERLKYFRIIDDKITSANVVDDSCPLLLAGAVDEISGYREASRANNLLEASLHGNYTETAPHETHDLSWPLIVEELNKKAQAANLEKIRSLLGTGRASISIEEISAATKEGRVATFLIGLLTMTRDTVKDSTELVLKLVFSEQYEKNQIAECARSVFDQGGEVAGLLKEEMPSGAGVAAIFRY